MRTVYFAHPVTHYDQLIEEECLQVIVTMLSDLTKPMDLGPDIEVMNPNQKWLSDLYNKRKQDNHDDPFSIFEEIAESCDITVGVTFLDGVFGAGVANEMQKALEKGKEVYTILFHEGKKLFLPVTSLASYKILTIEETRERNKKGKL